MEPPDPCKTDILKTLTPVLFLKLGQNEKHIWNPERMQCNWISSTWIQVH